MIDTVTLQHRIFKPLTKEVLSQYNWLPKSYDYNGSVTRFICNEPRGSHAPRLTLSKSPDGKWYLIAEVSIPAWFYGTNTKLPTQRDVLDSLNDLSMYVSDKSQLDFNANLAKVRRVDFTEDFPIGRKNIIPTIERLSKVYIPRFSRTVYDEKTVVFRNKGHSKSKVIKIYDKLAEIIDKKKHIPNQDEIKDLLRLEVSLVSSYSILKLKREYGLQNVLAESVLRMEVSKPEIQKAKTLIYLDSEIYQGIDKLDLLIANYGSKYAATLFGFLKLIEDYGFDFHKLSFLNYAMRTYRKHLNECKNAGVFQLESNTVKLSA